MKGILILLLVLTSAVFCFGQAASFKVSIMVESKNKQTQEAIESYITQGLLALGDVELTDKDAYYQIRIIGLEDENAGARRTEYTLSAVINWRATCTGVGQRKSCYVLDEHLLIKGNNNDLRSLCDQITVFFDSHSLKPLRPTAKQ
jgi:hypothetical protein